MPQSARILDQWTGICCCHNNPTCISMGGYIIGGSPNVISTSQKQGRLLDTTIGFCGHTGIIISVSSTVNANSLGDARIGDAVTGCNIGTIITGNPTHIVGG